MEEIRENGAQDKPVEDKDEEAKSEETEPSTEETERSQRFDEEEIAKIQQEVEEANDVMLRLAAELDNYKKRTAKERQSQIKYGAQGIVQGLLPILDNFERAIESASKSRDFDSFLKGVKMIFKQMYDTLETKGVNRIDAVGKVFDPTIHEAVMQVISEEHPENIVVEELQKGYMLHDRVIRPSMVAVSGGAKEK